MATARMTKDFAVFDCDAHVNDPLDIWERYVPESKRDLVRDTYWCTRGGAWVNGTTVVGGGQIVGGGMYNPICIAGPQMNKRIMRKLISMTPLTEEQVTYLHHDGAVDPHARIRDMDLMGIDQVLVIPSMVIMNLPFAENAEGAAVFCQAYNDWCIDWCSEVPDRLFGAALLPLQSPERTVQELHRAAGRGMRVGLIRPMDARGAYPNDIAPVMLSPDSLDPVFRAFEESGIVLGIHTFPAMSLGRTAGPGLLVSPGEMLNQAGVDSQTLSFIFEMQDWLAQILLSGFLDRYRNLKMAVFESNSQWLPYLLATCDRLFDLYRNERAVPATRRPSEVFAEQCVISFESDEEPTLRQWDQFADIGIWASDCYHHDGADAWSALRVLDRVGAPADVQAKLMGENARRMYGIEGKLFVTEEPDPLTRPEWFPQGADLERFAEAIADPRHHADELRAMDLGENPLTTMAAQLALAMESPT
jgi:predicted TIM-barrel fold metal-dependent hydrolase